MDHLNIEVIQGFKDGILNLDGISECDLVVIQRIFPRHLDLYEGVIHKAREEKKRVIFDLDDFLFDLPDNHPERVEHVYTTAIIPMIRAVVEADLVTVSTDMLKEMLSGFNQNISVIPNYLDDKLWQLKDPTSNIHNDNPIIIGYMGTKTHEPDLKIISHVLLNCLKKYPDKVKFHLWGFRPPENLDHQSQVTWSPTVTYNYRDFSENFQKQNVDIFVAPIVDNLFNRCKSGIKYLEYSALGAPGIYSNLEPYNTLIKHEHDGFLAESEQDWEKYLSILIENGRLRNEVATNAQNILRSKWLLSKNSSRWLEVYELSKNYRPSIQENLNYNNTIIIRSASKQFFEFYSKKIDQLNRLESEIDIKNQTINKLENALNTSEKEIMQYVQSSGWRLTRPLRKIAKLFGK